MPLLGVEPVAEADRTERVDEQHGDVLVLAVGRYARAARRVERLAAGMTERRVGKKLDGATVSRIPMPIRDRHAR